MPYSDPEKQREYERKWIANRRNDWLKANGPCKHCGTWNNLQIDHIDPKTKVTHRIWSYKEEKRLKELVKCQVLCEDCHIEKGIQNGDIPNRFVHGTWSMSKRQNCRCDICVSFMKEYRHQEYLKYKDKKNKYETT